MCVFLPPYDLAPYDLAPPSSLWPDMSLLRDDEGRVVDGPSRSPAPPPSALLLPFAPSRRFVIGFGVAVTVVWGLAAIYALTAIAGWLAGGAP